MVFTDQQKEEIYQNYYQKVFGYIVSKINDVDTAEDLASTVFVKIYEKIDSFDETKASLSTWIYTIARNTLTDYYRSRRVFEEIPETFPENFSVEEEVCNKEMLEQLAEALQTLEERERDIIILRFYSGKSLKEIAEKMGISYSYIKVLQNNAFDKIKKILKK